MSSLILSASSVSTFLRCGHQWFLAYVEGIKSPPSLAMARGLAVHKAVEHNMVQKVASHEDVPVGDMLDAFSTSWDALSTEGLRVDEDKDPGEVKDGGVALTRLHHQEVSPLIQPIYVEHPVQFDINGITYSGQIDIVDEMGRIRDTKTTKNRPKPESYLFGMTGYAVAARQMTGEIETDVVLEPSRPPVVVPPVVAPAAAAERIAALTPAELSRLATQLEQAPAGGDGLAILGIVFLVLLALEFTGTIDIFKKVP
jgi:hypothetical protein